MVMPLGELFAWIFRGTSRHDAEHARFRASLSQLEQRELDLEVLTAELEARVELCEEAGRDDPLA